MTPRAVQAIALMQNALDNVTKANNLLLQEVAEAMNRESSVPETGPEEDSEDA